MSAKRKLFSKIFGSLFLLLFLLAIGVFSIDLIFGDGDGIMHKYHLNPLSIVFVNFVVVFPMLLIISKKNNLSNLGLIMFFTLLTLLVAEFAFRLLPKKNATQTINTCGKALYSKYDTVFFKNYLPNTSFDIQMCPVDGGQKVENRINSLAIRGPEIGKKNRQRIILVGDSYMQSKGMSFENTIGQKLEGLLEDTVEVIQHGNPSWSPLLEMNWILKTGMYLQPDKVILFIYYNDFFTGNSVGDEGYTSFCVFDENGLPAKFKFDTDKNWSKNLMLEDFVLNINKSRLIGFLKWNLRNKRFRKNFDSTDTKSILSMDEDDFQSLKIQKKTEGEMMESKRWGILSMLRPFGKWDDATLQTGRITLDYLKSLNQYLNENEVEFELCLIPNPWQFEDENIYGKMGYGFEDYTFPKGGVETFLSEFCEEQKIPFISLYNAFSEFKKTSELKLYFPNDGHWDAAGHQVAAETIAKRIQQQAKKAPSEE